MTRKYSSDYEFGYKELLTSSVNGQKGHLNRNFDDIDSRIDVLEDTVASLGDGYMSAYEIRTELNDDSSGPPIDAGTLDGYGLYDIQKSSFCTPRLKHMLRQNHYIGLTDNLVENRGAYHFNGRYIFAASGKNYYKIDPKSGFGVSPRKVVNTLAPDGDYEIKCITSDGTYLYLFYDNYDAASHADNYILKVDPETDENIQLNTISGGTDVGDVKFMFWNVAQEVLVYISDEGYVVFYDFEAETLTYKKHTNLSGALAYCIIPSTYVDATTTKIVFRNYCIILWQNLVGSNYRKLQYFDLEVADANDGEIQLANFSPYEGVIDNVIDMVYDPTHNGLFILSKDISLPSENYYYQLTFYRFQSTGDACTETWLIHYVDTFDGYGEIDETVFEPVLIDSCGEHLFIHSYLKDFDDQIHSSFNSRFYNGLHVTVTPGDNTDATRQNPSTEVGVYVSEQGFYGPDALSVDVDGYSDYNIIGKEFDGNCWYGFINSDTNTVSAYKSYIVIMPNNKNSHGL